MITLTSSNGVQVTITEADEKALLEAIIAREKELKLMSVLFSAQSEAGERVLGDLMDKFSMLFYGPPLSS